MIFMHLKMETRWWFLLDKEENKRKTIKLEQLRPLETGAVFAECNALYFHSSWSSGITRVNCGWTQEMSFQTDVALFM